MQLLARMAEAGADDLEEARLAGYVHRRRGPPHNPQHRRAHLGRRTKALPLHREEILRLGVELHRHAEQRELPGRRGDPPRHLVLHHDQQPVGRRRNFGQEAAQDRRGDRVGQVADQSVGRGRADGGERLGRLDIEDVAFEHDRAGRRLQLRELPPRPPGHRGVELDGGQRAVERGEAGGQRAATGADFEQRRGLCGQRVDNSVEHALIAQQVLSEAASFGAAHGVRTPQPDAPGMSEGVAVHLPSNAAMSLPPLAGSAQALPRHPKPPAYRCFLSDLTGFTVARRAGPRLQHHLTSVGVMT